MKITGIKAQGMLRIKQVDLKCNAAIQIICGGNRHGKSSLLESLRMAISGEQVRDVTKVKDMHTLVNDGAKAGGVVVEIDNTADKSFALHLPKGARSGPDITDAMRVAANGARFSEMTPDERRVFLLSLTGEAADKATIQQWLIADGCNATFAQEIMIALHASGFAGAQKEAESNATAAKQTWKLISNLTWGPKQAEGWAAPVPDVLAHDVEVLRASIKVQDDRQAGFNEQIGAAKQAMTTAKQASDRRAALQASVTRLPELEKLLPVAIKERDDYQIKVEALRQRAKGTHRAGLVHDLAVFVHGIKFQDDPRAIRQAELMRAYDLEHGPVADGEKADPAAIASLPEHEKGLQVLMNRAANLQRDIDAARMAKGQFDALAPAQTVELPNTDDLNEQLTDCRAERQRLQNLLLDVEAAQRGRAEAASKTAKAKAEHEKVMAWLKIAERLSPSGIQAEMLAAALEPVNEALDQAAADTGWPLVQILPDMSMLIAGKTRNLESPSGMWRADAMIAQAVSELSGLKLLLLDGADILEPADRGVLLEWLHILVDNDALDSAHVNMTTAKLIDPPRPTMETHWIEDGRITESRAYSAQEAA